MKQHGLVGAEFLAGIPGTLGGACAMNAGTKNGECMTRGRGGRAGHPDGVGWVDARRSSPFAYRHTDAPAGRGRHPRALPAAARATWPRRRQKMDADLGYRKRTQPLTQPNFGSVFTNPPGDHAGRLIETVGLKGHTVGRRADLHAPRELDRQPRRRDRARRGRA